ncbi:unnamed protein product [Closterium sp. Yama58-4]|nr:unnamed protein product [Closterium sp. Yama58-4]
MRPDAPVQGHVQAAVQAEPEALVIDMSAQTQPCQLAMQPQLPSPSFTTPPGTTPLTTSLTTPPVAMGIFPSGSSCAAAPVSVHRPVASLPPVPNHFPNLVPNHEQHAGSTAAHLHQFHLPQVLPAQAAEDPQAAHIHGSMSHTQDFVGMAGNAMCASGVALSPVLQTTAAEGGGDGAAAAAAAGTAATQTPVRKGRIYATRGAEGGSGDRERPVDETASATAADKASEKGPRVNGENDSNGAAANNEAGSTGDAARRIWDVSGRDLVQVALEASGATDGPRFLAPCGVRRELPLLVYLPGLDGTGVFLERHLEGLKPCYDVRCLCIPAADTSSYNQLAQL